MSLNHYASFSVFSTNFTLASSQNFSLRNCKYWKLYAEDAYRTVQNKKIVQWISLSGMIERILWWLLARLNSAAVMQHLSGNNSIISPTAQTSYQHFESFFDGWKFHKDTRWNKSLTFRILNCRLHLYNEGIQHLMFCYDKVPQQWQKLYWKVM